MFCPKPSIIEKHTTGICSLYFTICKSWKYLIDDWTSIFSQCILFKLATSLSIRYMAPSLRNSNYWKLSIWSVFLPHLNQVLWTKPRVWFQFVRSGLGRIPNPIWPQDHHRRGVVGRCQIRSFMARANSGPREHLDYDQIDSKIRSQTVKDYATNANKNWFRFWKCNVIRYGWWVVAVDGYGGPTYPTISHWGLHCRRLKMAFALLCHQSANWRLHRNRLVLVLEMLVHKKRRGKKKGVNSIELCSEDKMHPFYFKSIWLSPLTSCKSVNIGLSKISISIARSLPNQSHIFGSLLSILGWHL